MAVLLECPKCSSTLRIGEAVLGKKVKCPKCQTIFPAKEPEPDVLVEEEIIEEEILEEEHFDDDDLDVLDEPGPKKSKRDGIIQGDLPRPRRANRYDDEEDDEDRFRKKRQRYDEDEDEYDDRPARKRRRDEDDEEYDRPRKNRKKESQQGWYDVSAGISTILTSIYGYLLICLSTLVLYPMAILFRSFAVLMVGIGLFYLALLCMFGLNVYGHYLNLYPPIRRDISLKGISLATFICLASSLGSVLLEILITIITMASMGSVLGGGFSINFLFSSSVLILILHLIFCLGLIAGQVLFLIFLHGICRAFDKNDKAWGVIVFVIASVCLMFGQGLILVLMFSMTPNLFVYMFLLVLYLGASLTILIWYIMLLNGVRNVIDSGLR